MKKDWFLEMTDLTIRSKDFKNTNTMADYKGCIICDLKHALGVGKIEEIKMYLKGQGGRQHAWNEVIEIAEEITGKNYNEFKIKTNNCDHEPDESPAMERMEIQERIDKEN